MLSMWCQRTIADIFIHKSFATEFLFEFHNLFSTENWVLFYIVGGSYDIHGNNEEEIIILYKEDYDTHVLDPLLLHVETESN